jgi:tetratricopeptide (TPR) repeat protein
VSGFGGSPFILGLGGVFLPIVYTPMYVPPPMPFGGGLMLPNPTVPARGAMPVARTVSRPEPARSDNYVNIGDNLFRAGNRHRAEQRYTQAVRANPNSAKPHVRIAQLALVRGDYAEAAEQFRAATTAEPGWLINATDVQALFAEPADFAQALAKLETHLQATPGDRNGWLVLGAEWYLSGRTRQAADVFTRLNDRKPDATLASFLDATTPDAIARDPR